MKDRQAGRRILDLAAPYALVAVLAACGGAGGGLTVNCPAIMYSARLEVRLDASWSDPDAYGVTVRCPGTTESCGLVRDGTIRLVPEPETTTVPTALPDRPEPAEPSPEPTGADAPEEEPTAGAWTGSALNGPVETILVRVVDRATGEVVHEDEVAPRWEVSGDDVSPCGGPSLATVEIADPRA